MKTEMLEVNGIKYPVKLFIEERSDNTVSIRKNSVNVHICSSLSRNELFREILRMKAWARQKIAEQPEKFKPKEVKTYSDGQELKVGNEKFTLNIEFKEKSSSSARIKGNNIFLCISSGLSDADKKRHTSTLLSRLIAAKRLPELQKRIEELNARHFNHNLKKIFFKNNKSNFGSCSKAGNINISTSLLFAPDEVLNYVCVHELAHLAEHNHSDGFWVLVEKAMPDYKDKKNWLKENGENCGF